MTQNENQNFLYDYMRIIYMVMLCLHFFQQMDLNQ